MRKNSRYRAVSHIDGLDRGHAELLAKSVELQKIVMNLPCEEGARLAQRLKRACEILVFLKRKVRRHFKLEERVLFPFLKKHIPKLESILCLLESEHEQFLAQLGIFQTCLRDYVLSARRLNTGGQALERVRIQGACVAYLLRNHIEAENATIYKAISNNLHHQEIQVLRREIHNDRSEAAYREQLVL